MRSDEDGTNLAHILHGSKGGNAPRAPDEMRDFYPPQASYSIEVVLHTYYSVSTTK